MLQITSLVNQTFIDLGSPWLTLMLVVIGKSSAGPSAAQANCCLT